MVQGWNDSELTENGIFQAKCTGYGMKDILFQKACSGDSKRQIATAEILMSENKNPIPVTADWHFREGCYGKYEEGSYAEMLGPLFTLNGDHYSSYKDLYKYYDDVRIAELLEKFDETHGFEGLEHTADRFITGMDRLTETVKEGNILVASSGLAILALVNKLFPDSDHRYIVDNAAVTVIEFDGTYHLLIYNDISYRIKGEQYYSDHLI